MKSIKSLLSVLSATAALTFAFSACSQNAAVNNATANTNKSNTAVVVNSNQAVKNATPPVSNTATNANQVSGAATPAAKFDSQKIQGELQKGNTESVILYFGEESGDYAGYCFMNDSEAGRAILAACKDGEQCAVDGEIDGEASCKVPGLEADLSASGRILRIKTAKSLGRKK